MLSGRKTCLSRVMVGNTICSSKEKHKQQYIVVYRAPKREILFLPESTEGVAVGATTAMDYENAADSTENDTETVAK